MCKKFFLYTISALLIAAISGCSMFAPQKQVVTVNGKPAGATVVINGQEMTAPVSLAVQRNKHVTITVSKEGYNSHVFKSDYILSSYGILDVVGGACFLVPFIGLASPGAFELTEDTFYYNLTPADK